MIQMSQATTTASSTTRVALGALRMSRRILHEILDSLTEEQAMHVPVKGGNHALWTMGHLAMADQFFLKEIGGIEPSLPADWESIFGWGHPCQTDATVFPPVSDVRKAMDTKREEVLAWFESMTEDQLDAATGDEWRDFAPTVRDLIGAMSIHEGVHSGQLMVVRKSLELPPLNM